MQDQGNTAAGGKSSGNPNPMETQTQTPTPTPAHGQPFPFRGTFHRRAHSEVHFRLSEDLDLGGPNPFDASSGSCFDDHASEDDLFSTYMDIEKLGSRPDGSSSSLHLKSDNAGGAGIGVVNAGGPQVLDSSDGGEAAAALDGDKNGSRHRHRYSNSVDGSSLMDSIEAKKAMAPDKLAELWALDPKRAKRIIANRQSAARSKERKARYISELERKVQTLQTEATTLSAQLTLFQRDTTGLSNENTELKLRLQAMEQQAQLRDALNEALKKEVERLKVATGEIMTPTETYNLGMHHIPYTQSPFFRHQQQTGPVDAQNAQMLQYHPFQPNVSSAHQPVIAASHAHAFSDILPNDHLGRLQRLDISSRSSHLVKSEGPSISASESSST